MTIIIDSPELQDGLEREAAKRGAGTVELAIAILSSYLSQEDHDGVPLEAGALPAELPDEAERRRQAILGIESLGEIGTEEEQRETFEALERATNKGRDGDRTDPQRLDQLDT